MTPHAPAAASPPPTGYARRLGLFSATMLVVGGIIGSGIFLNPAIVAQRLGTAGLTLTAWALGALVALLGAFVFAELGARAPAAGGGYVYLRAAFGALPAFLYGWALLLAIASGAIAAVAVTFARYAAAGLGLAQEWHLPLGIGAIALLTVVNILGVRPGAVTQNVFTVLKLLAIAAVVAAGIAGTVSVPVANGIAGAAIPAGPSSFPSLVAAMGTALVPVLFSYGGWQQSNFVAEEIVEPRRNLPRALVMGVIAVAIVYLLANLTYVRVLGVAGLAASTAPAADVLGARFGPAGRALITAGIAASTFGFLNLVILVTPRVYQAMARDGLFFGRLAALHPRWRTPVAAIALQSAWAVVLLLSGTYGQLLDWVTFADWIFFGATAATLFVYRRREHGTDPANYRTMLHPVGTLVFIAASAFVVWGSILSNPGNALRGALLLVAGVPAYWYWRHRSGPRTEPPHP
jgi:APA family basic amino acid/polyamine antiporter